MQAHPHLLIDRHRLIADPAELPELLDAWHAETPHMTLLALVPEGDLSAIPALQTACRERRITLVGAVFPELLGDAGFIARGLWLLRLPDAPPALLIPDLRKDGTNAAADIAAAIAPALAHMPPQGGGLPLLFLIFDAMLPNIGSILTGLFSRLKHRVRFAGANAGSETFTSIPCLFDAEHRIADGAIAILMPRETRAVVKHGYPTSRSLMRASSTAGNRIDRIDGRPAFDVYREVVRSEFGVDLNHDNFYDLAVHFPFGLITAIDVLVRIPVAYGEDGSLICVGEVPPNSFVILLRAPELDKSNCVAEIGRAMPDSHAADALLAFYCAGRRLHFGREQAALEVVQLKTTTGVPALVGALSLGEIDTEEMLGFPRFHNASLVCLR